MTGLAILLVLVSAFAHASWNLLAKRGGTPEVTNWLMAASGAVTMLPVAAVLFALDPPSGTGWAFIAATIGLHIVYFFALGRAYRYGDLSIVYPVARGLGLTLIPILGTVALSETVSWPAAVGIGFIFTGVVVVGLSSGGAGSSMLNWRRLIRDRGVLFAVLTGVIIGTYSVVDKRGVEHVTPVLYMFFLSAGGALGSLAIIHRSYSRAQFVTEFSVHWKAIVMGGLLQFAAYSLVLSAFRLSQVSYVGPFREFAVAIGVILSAVILHERVTRLRLLGTASLTTGAIIVATAP